MSDKKRTLDDILKSVDHAGAYGCEEPAVREAYALGKSEVEEKISLLISTWRAEMVDCGVPVEDCEQCSRLSKYIKALTE